MRRTGAWLAASAALAACGEDLARLQTVPEPTVGIDELEQRAASAVDVLWVIDSSGSMEDEQAALAVNLSRFIEALALCRGSGVEGDLCQLETRTCSVSGAPCVPVDYHVGAITMDLASPDERGKLRLVGRCVPAVGRPPAGDVVRWCRSGAHCADRPGADDYHPENVVCDGSQGIRWATPATPSMLGAFARMVVVGTEGSAVEQGLAAAALALGVANDEGGEPLGLPFENVGFLREDALLYVVFLTDEDDESPGSAAQYARSFETLKGPGNEALVSVGAIVGDPDPDGPDGAAEGSCTGNGNLLTANAPGKRYLEVAIASRGLEPEVRGCDGVQLGCAPSELCAMPLHDLPGLCLPAGCGSDDDCGGFTCAGGRCEAAPDALLGHLERQAVWASICAPDYAAVLEGLGLAAAGLRRKFPLSRWPDCAVQVPCGDDGASRPGLCVLVDGAEVPRGADGYTYDPVGNAIFFGGGYVPPPSAKLEVRYGVNELAGPGCAP